jgi:hypothetical protein
MQGLQQTPWNTHDFKVKALDWSATRGSRLAFSCRFCGRRFCRFSSLGRGTWAVDSDGHELENAVTERWLAERCPRLFGVQDEEDRKRLSKQ